METNRLVSAFLYVICVSVSFDSLSLVKSNRFNKCLLFDLLNTYRFIEAETFRSKRQKSNFQMFELSSVAMNPQLALCLNLAKWNEIVRVCVCVYVVFSSKKLFPLPDQLTDDAISRPVICRKFNYCRAQLTKQALSW